MNDFRWFAYLPAALVASIAVGAAFYWAGNFFGNNWLDAGHWVGWVASGLGSGIAFIAVGLKVAPVQSSGVKWSLVGPVFLLGAVSALGSLMAGQEKSTALAGIVMMLVAIGAARTPVSNLDFGSKQRK